MRGIFKRSLRFVALTMVICTTWVSSSLAAAPTPKPDTSVPDEAIVLAQKAGSFARITPTGILFDQDGALKAGLSKDYVVEMATFFDSLTKLENNKQFNWEKLLAEQATHQHVRYGEVKQDPTGDITPDYSYRSGWGWAGQYVQISFTEYETVLIIDALVGVTSLAGAYAALATLLATFYGITLPAAVIVGFVAAVFGIGAWALTTIDHIGGNRGIYVRLYVRGTATVWHN